MIWKVIKNRYVLKLILDSNLWQARDWFNAGKSNKGVKFRNNMFLVGLTGGISTGKSTVSKILSEECGCTILDADIIAREG